jgi:hypothetical protein
MTQDVIDGEHLTWQTMAALHCYGPSLPISLTMKPPQISLTDWCDRYKLLCRHVMMRYT